MWLTSPLPPHSLSLDREPSSLEIDTRVWYACHFQSWTRCKEMHIYTVYTTLKWHPIDVFVADYPNKLWVLQNLPQKNLFFCSVCMDSSFRPTTASIQLRPGPFLPFFSISCHFAAVYPLKAKMPPNNLYNIQNFFFLKDQK